ncbi:MAG: RNA polymerase sigma factor [Candidatus Roseilinea sp.]|uniref:RNA polymerase sigma factor n=1 Tax=Candidatus Roseilinea sp. TaxID=2838777 RepID=UPI00404A0275
MRLRRLIPWIESALPREAAAPLDWDAMYEALLPRVYSFFMYRVGDVAQAEDLTSTTFEKAWRARDRYQHDRAAFSTWLFSIARNVATDYFRRRRVELSLDEVHGAPDDAARLPERVAEDHDERARLASLLARLPARERDLLALKYGAGMTNREIARQTGLTESNVGTIISRTVQALRRQWESADQ